MHSLEANKPGNVKNRSTFFQRHWSRSLYPVADQIQTLKKGIWIYFLLLIFEGALRKWILPGLATPLLIIRDPLALWLLLMSWKQGLLRINGYIFIMQIIGIGGIYTAIFFGHGNFSVALFGARIFLLHFPLIFVIGQIFNRSDVILVGKAALIIAIPMTLLITVQFYSPQTAWVNRGIGGDTAGGGFDGVLGYFRPPGTFAFTNGVALFFGLVGCFIFYFWIHQKDISKLLLVAATGSLLIAIPLSLSRTVFFQAAISFLFAVIGILRNPRYVIRMILAVTIGFVVVAIFNRASFFQTATVVFTERLTTATEQEGGLGSTLNSHFLGDLVSQIAESFRQPFFGYGLGMGTNVGSMLLGGQRVFLIAESEWMRTIGELGAVMGLTVIFLRLLLGAKITLRCFRKMKEGDVLPWMLLSFGLYILVEGGWAQPTSLGFCVLISGLMLASLNAELK